MSRKNAEPKAIAPYLRGKRYYADTRAYASVGGKLHEALMEPNAKRATMDLELAQQLLAQRITHYGKRRHGAVTGVMPGMGLAAASAAHLTKKRQAGQVEWRWIAAHETMLQRAVTFLGSERELHTIKVSDVDRWVEALRKAPTKREAGRMNDATVRHHLNALSNLFQRAQSEEWVPPGYNPVAAKLEKPRGTPAEAKFLEVPDAALLLEAARTLPPVSHAAFDPTMTHAIVAAFLLTGGRKAEVLGLKVKDVSFEHLTVTFRVNGRRLKNEGSARVVPLWPQLETILHDYLNARTAGEVFDNRPASRLLFPSYSRRKGMEQPIVDFRSMLDKVAVYAGWKAGEVQTRIFRNTYISARLQTLDGGAPVSPFTVAKESGHSTLTMIMKIYGHLGTVRHRSEVVEYRVEQHEDKLAERRRAMADRLAVLEAEWKAREERKRSKRATVPA